jgi:hypothetical protein
MKRLSFFIVLLALIVGMTVTANAQATANQLNVTNTATYTASTNDTTVGRKLCGALLLGYRITVGDSASIEVVFQHSSDNSAWTTLFRDTLTNTGATSNAGTIKQVAIRSSAVDQLGGRLGGWLRTVTVPAAAGATIGVSSPTLKQEYLYR